MAEAPVSATCTLHAFTDEWGVPVSDSTLVACGERTVAVITIACLHEHVDIAHICAACSVDIQMAAEVMICPRCADGPDPHECKVAIQIGWQDKENDRG